MAILDPGPRIGQFLSHTKSVVECVPEGCLEQYLGALLVASFQGTNEGFGLDDEEGLMR